jgi:hypothetical protein
LQATTVVFMVLVLGVLWGGFATLLALSMKAEKRRSLDAGGSGPKHE